MKRDELYISIPEAVALGPEEYDGQKKAIGGFEIRLKNRRIQLYQLETGVTLRFKRYLPSIKRITVSDLGLTDGGATALMELLLQWALKKKEEQCPTNE
jgi:hypothetical protein